MQASTTRLRRLFDENEITLENFSKQTEFSRYGRKSPVEITLAKFESKAKSNVNREFLKDLQIQVSQRKSKIRLSSIKE